MDRRRFFTGKQALTEQLKQKQQRYSLDEAFSELDRLYEDVEEEAEGDAAEKETAKPEQVVDKLQNSTNYEQFVKILDSDGKSKAFLNYLKNHYKLGDDAIGTVKAAKPQEGIIKCASLIPTQKNISLSKSLGMIEEPGWSIKIINTPTEAFDTPTVTYAGKYIIDGHHRWSKAYALNGGDCKIKVLNFPAIEGVSWEDLLKAVQLAIVAAVPGAKLVNVVDDDNMLTLDKNAIAKFFTENACDEVVEALTAKGYGDSKEKVAERVADNVIKMQATSQPVKGAKARAFMPQMDDPGKAKAQIMTKGIIDMTD